MSSSLLDPAGPVYPPNSQLAPQSTGAPVPPPNAGKTGPGIATASAISIVFFLSIFVLLALLACAYWTRKGWIASKQRPSERETALGDVEALEAGTRPVVPVTPSPSVRWVPQIRSISGPRQDEDTDRKPATLPPKRARSPPPPYSSGKLARNLSDFHPKSAPVHVLSFSQHDGVGVLEKDGPKGGQLPPVTPQALAVSGMETRTLERTGLGPKS